MLIQRQRNILDYVTVTYEPVLCDEAAPKLISLSDALTKPRLAALEPLGF